MDRFWFFVLPVLMAGFGCGTPEAAAPVPEVAEAEETVAVSPESEAFPGVRRVPVGPGWAKNSVNTSIFRTRAVTTHGDRQVVAYYDSTARVVLAERRTDDSVWTVRRTRFSGRVEDAHNAISIGIDGAGVLHMVWDLHNQPIRYVQSREPGSLDLADERALTGRNEDRATYPEFFALPDGDLLFLYRDGASGDGNTLLNRYDVDARIWTALHHPLISGEGARNPYTNGLVVDPDGVWHLSWCWRETPDVATNHDLLYARSRDEGRTWETSTGRPYGLPITAETAEVIRSIPQGSDLINQTTMTVDAAGRPMVATYWTPDGADVPQLHLVWHDGQVWQTSQITRRRLAFTLGGSGTRSIPLSRPHVLADSSGAYVFFRDDERGGVVSVAVSRAAPWTDWRVVDLSSRPLGRWEPNLDVARWRRDGVVHLFEQRVGQGDGERLEQDMPAQPVSILEWRPGRGVTSSE